MSDKTVKQLADQFKLDVNLLIEKLNTAGIEGKDENSSISSREQIQLMQYLKNQNTSSTKPAPQAQKIKPTVSKSTATKKPSVAPSTKKTSAAEMARQLAEKKRQQQGNDQRESEQKRQEEETKRAKERAEKEAELKKQRALDKEKRQKEAKEKAEQQEKLKAQELETKRKAEAERLKNLEKDAELNAKQELDKQKTRELEAAKHKEADDIARKQADEEYQNQLRVERMGASKFRENRKEVRKEQRKKKQPAFVANNRHKFEKPQKQVSIEVELPETITVGDLAQKANKKSAELIMVLMKMGSMVTINQVLDRDTASLLLEEMGIKYTYINENEAEEALIESIEQKYGDEQTRPPIVTIMGHVDHGKTSLLDYIRSTRVTAGEAGGITQHIGSYHVETDNGIITFLDTPGHAAFTAMRARGAQVTDVVVIVVAADDGIMPQTVEAIQHAKAANAPIIIAINKIDKPEADPEKIKGELTQHEIVTEDWGGDVMIAHVSAKTGEGVDQLLEKILLESEVLELTAPFKGPAKGIIIESRVDKGRGVVASVLVQKGSLQKGNFVLSGMKYGRIRAMSDENGQPVTQAGPSIPVEVLGLSGAPQAGDELIVVENEKVAKELANQRHVKANEIKIAKQQKAKLENLFANVGDNQLEEVNVLIKTDVQGSAEALRESLLKLSTDEVAVKVVSSTVGGITESDINLAIASQAMIIGFNVRAESGAKRLAEQEGVNLHYYSIIYEAIEDIKQAMVGKLSPEIKEEIVGIAEVREVFKAPKIGQIAGSMVVDGYVKKSNPIRVLRDNVVIYEGELESLRRFKDDVNEVRAGTECGIGVKNYNDVKVGDQIECYERKEVAREL